MRAFLRWLVHYNPIIVVWLKKVPAIILAIYIALAPAISIAPQLISSDIHRF